MPWGVIGRRAHDVPKRLACANDRVQCQRLKGGAPLDESSVRREQRVEYLIRNACDRAVDRRSKPVPLAGQAFRCRANRPGRP